MTARRAASRRWARVTAWGAAGGLAVATTVSAQFVTFDPTNYANALLRYAELEKQYAQLVFTYEQIRTEYELLVRQAQSIPVVMNLRYRSLATPWLPFVSATAYGTTSTWIATANTGADASAAFSLATSRLRPYGGALASLSADESSRVQTRYDRVQLTDAAITHGLEALGSLRGHQLSVEQSILHLEEDAYSGNPDFQTQIAVLNKINATAVTAARVAQDTTNVLVSLLEQQLLERTDGREAAVEALNAHIAFETDVRPLLAATTAHTTEALTTFRIP